MFCALFHSGRTCFFAGGTWETWGTCFSCGTSVFRFRFERILIEAELGWCLGIICRLIVPLTGAVVWAGAGSETGIGFAVVGRFEPEVKLAAGKELELYLTTACLEC